MGLDGVELVMEVEDRFRISIPDDVASGMRTAGELSDYVETRVAGAGGGCWSRRVFYRLRAAMKEVVQIRPVRPGDTIEDVVPLRGRRAAWARLAERSGYEFPKLIRPGWLVAILVGVPVAVLVMGIGLGRTGGWAFVVAFAWPMVGLPLTLPLATRIPGGVRTVGDLAHWVMAGNRVEDEGAAALGRDEVWQVVRRIVAEQMGVEVERVGRESRFVDDLGMG